MCENDLTVIDGKQVYASLRCREMAVLEVVEAAYIDHDRGDCALPPSVFLRFPGDNRNRIIAKPAYLGASFKVAGVKWVSSFPGNLSNGFDRASAVIVLNSTTTGRPTVLIEGSLISAKRTAASAALAAARLVTHPTPSSLGIIGCGVINFEVMKFTKTVMPSVTHLVLFDAVAARAESFAAKCKALDLGFRICVARNLEEALSLPLVALATTATTPHINSLACCAKNAVILHISLRDLSPDVILNCVNVVDDVDHVCSEKTSLHLAQIQVGNRDFIRCTIGQILAGTASEARCTRDKDAVTVFSPFGLAILDLAVAHMVHSRVTENGGGHLIRDFLPRSAPL